MQVKKQQLELDMEQQTDSKLGKDYVKAVYCYHAWPQVATETPSWMTALSWQRGTQGHLRWMGHSEEF